MIFITQAQFDEAVETRLSTRLADAARILDLCNAINGDLHVRLQKSLDLTHAAVATNGFINDQLVLARGALRDLVTECESKDMIMLSDSLAYHNAKDVLAGPKKQ